LVRFELRRGGLSAAVESRGGELVSFCDGSRTEYIWSGDPAFWPGRNPLLFPIVGNLKNGTVTFGSGSYQMSRHGFARDNEFTVLEHTADKAVLELRENDDTLSRYPYPFSLQVTHRLIENGFCTSFRVENTGHQPMPFCIGAHTGFCCPLHGGECFEDYRIVFDKPEVAALTLLTPEGLISHCLEEPFLKGQDSFALDRALFDRVDTIILKGLRSSGVSLLHKDTGRGLRMEFGGFPMLAFWTKSGVKAPFICIEPWHGCAALDNESGIFEEKPGCIVLQPTESRELKYTVTLK